MWMYLFFFFNDPATTAIYTLSLHDALPIYSRADCDSRHARVLSACERQRPYRVRRQTSVLRKSGPDRKSTRLNSSHVEISYAVFCLKKKINLHRRHPPRTILTPYS